MNNEDFKVVLSDKEYIEKLEKEVYYQNKEVTRLNNIINELEKWLKAESQRLHDIVGNNFTTVGQAVFEEVLDKLKELKEKNND